MTVKPEAAAQECPVCLETPCSHFHNAVPATSAPSQPAQLSRLADLAAAVCDAWTENVGTKEMDAKIAELGEFLYGIR